MALEHELHFTVPLRGRRRSACLHSKRDAPGLGVRSCWRRGVSRYGLCVRKRLDCAEEELENAL